MCCGVLYGNRKAFVNAGLEGKMIRGQWTTEDGFGLFCIDCHLLSCLCCHRIYMPSTYSFLFWLSHCRRNCLIICSPWKHSQPSGLHIQAFHFPNEITDKSPPLVPVISEWTVIYFTYSLWMKLHFPLIHFPAPPLCPGDQWRLIRLSLEVEKLAERVSLWLFVCLSDHFHYLKLQVSNVLPRLYFTGWRKQVNLHRISPVKSRFYSFFRLISCCLVMQGDSHTLFESINKIYY